jgi:dihydroorotate dehydrogenase (NAD+) catalytic subunit
MGLALGVEIAGIKLKNPILSASGCFGYGDEAQEFFDISQLGGVVTKSITPLPRVGHPPPKVAETASGMLNAIGLSNIGLERFIVEKMPFLRNCKCAVIVNVAGRTINDYTLLAKRISAEDGVHGLEINISCPNVDAGGLEFGASETGAAKVINSVKKVSKVPIIAKLSPNVTDIAAIARAVENAGADAISLINTLVGAGIDIKTREFRLSNKFGGLSGPAIKPVAVAMVYRVTRAVKIPVIGLGGISCGADVIEFMLAGATAVQIGTACFAEPKIFLRVLDELTAYLEEHGHRDINEIIGAVKGN